MNHEFQEEHVNGGKVGSPEQVPSHPSERVIKFPFGETETKSDSKGISVVGNRGRVIELDPPANL